MWRLGDDDAMLDVVTSANVACGFHAGDPAGLARTCRAAAERGVRIGAQVGYRDLAGFGRRFIDVSAEDLTADVDLSDRCAAGAGPRRGGDRRYVKPHGALYNTIVTNRRSGRCRRRGGARRRPRPAGSRTRRVGVLRGRAKLGLRTVPEAFADRAYRPDGQLVSRREPNAVLHDVEAIAERVSSMVTAGRVDRRRRFDHPDRRGIRLRARRFTWCRADRQRRPRSPGGRRRQLAAFT